MNDKLDIEYMRLALKEAKKGLGKTSPNPCVGAVIVRDGKVIAKGFHKKAGTPHAEINALKNATKSVVGATIYVTLEPCNHTGKTPPCSHAIVAAGLARVVVGMTDPNPLVNGGGIVFLESHGIQVVSGVLEEECRAINSPFIKHITEGIPWTIMKAGVSLDGRLNYQEGQAGWITGEESAYQVHKLRNCVDAILVGRKTVDIDNPSLTTRLPRGVAKDPVRVIVDSDLSTSLDSKVYHLDSGAPTWVVCAEDCSKSQRAKFEELGVRIISVERKEQGLNLQHLLKLLGSDNICSLLVEGGSSIHRAFLKEKLYDYAYLFYAPLFAGDAGVGLVGGYKIEDRHSAPRLAKVSHKRLGDDMLISGHLRYS